jgi:hypothetical protein
LSGYANGEAISVNDAGQTVGTSYNGGFDEPAIEWGGGSVIDQGGRPGSAFSIAEDINSLGQAAGEDYVDGTDNDVEWSGGNIINRGGSALFEGQERLLWIAVSPGSKPGVLTVTARVDQAQRASLNRRAAVSIRPRGAGIRRAGAPRDCAACVKGWGGADWGGQRSR